MKFYDSYEVERLRKLIANKESYLQTLSGDKSKASYQLTQREIMVLKNDLLPVVLNNTSVVHSEFVKYAVRAFDASLEHKMNALLMYVPIDENYTDRPKVAVFNSRANLASGTPGAVEIFVDNIDDNGCNFQPMNINFNTLI